MIYQTIKEEHHRLQKQICELQNQISQYPDGKLICSQGQNCFKWYKSDGHVKTYIPKSNRILAEQLAAKKYLSQTLKKLIREKNAFERYLKHHKEPDPSDDDRIISNPGYRELLSPYFKLDSDEQTEWMNVSQTVSVIDRTIKMYYHTNKDVYTTKWPTILQTQ